MTIVAALPRLAWSCSCSSVRLVHHALQQSRSDPDTVLRWGSLPGRGGRAGRGGSHSEVEESSEKS